MAEKANERITKERAYGEKSVRTIWDPKAKKMYFCVRDIVGAVTNNADTKDYLKKMRKRDPELSKSWSKIARFMQYATTGSNRKLNFVDIEGASKVMNTIVSERAEPFKKWMEKQQAKLAK